MTLLFLGFEILKYWDILIEYINPLTILLWLIVGGIIGILLSILLLFIFRKWVLVKRYHWTLKCLSYAYLLILPLFVGFSFAQWLALHNCEQQIVRNIPKYMDDTQILYDTYLKTEVEKIISEEILRLSGNELLRGTVETAQSLVGSAIVGESEDQAQTESYKGKVSTYLVQTFLKGDYVKELIVSEARNQIGQVLLTDKNMTKELFDMEIQTLLDNGVIHTVLEKQIKHLIGGFKMNVLLILLAVLLVVCIEIVIARWFHKKKQKTPLPIPVVTPPIPPKGQ